MFRHNSDACSKARCKIANPKVTYEVRSNTKEAFLNSVKFDALIDTRNEEPIKIEENTLSEEKRTVESLKINRKTRSKSSNKEDVYNKLKIK